MTTFKNTIFLSKAQQLTIVFLLLVTQLNIIYASTIGEITDLQEQQQQPKQSGEVIKKLTRYGSLYRSSGEHSDDRSLFESLFGGKRATVPLHFNVNTDVASKTKQLISWIRRQSLQDTSLEDADKTDAPENRETVKAGLSKMAKRMMNCKPLKEQFKEFRGKCGNEYWLTHITKSSFSLGEVFKKGDNSFKNNLRDFLANCNNNDGIRF